MMIKQQIIKIVYRTYDNGTMGFHDYETVYEEFEKFIDRVTELANEINGVILSISYPNSEMAIIAYKEV